ncbi:MULTISPECIES: TIGR04282 family arsenosugar biosynthesis glycosyltransferase [Emticicia]|uniref:TIGR04282 family arsenosugar biosynthesis glycosyltransferase n=1 Tax=Emticicia TaxID=312278 RepID=UPI0007D8987D|nr:MULTISPECIES: TIGR04282 family arsenosugar biosynthesis glycosyltransferase [Emticicia]
MKAGALTDKNFPPKCGAVQEEAIIIFIKNPRLGKVKTRLAATLGNERALEIYHELMAHTMLITSGLPVDKYLFYSDFVDNNDIWNNEMYKKSVQHEGNDLGLKMLESFMKCMNTGHKKALIIGSDCLELSAELIEDGFKLLSEDSVVIGPANDGGYYMIGFNFELLSDPINLLENLFLNKAWSHENVLKEAIEVCKKLSISIAELPTLTDVDEEKDYEKTKHLALKLVI